MIRVDASVAAKWVLQEEPSDRAQALYRENLKARSSIVVPSLLLFEVTNFSRQQMRRANPMSLVAASLALNDFFAFEIEISSPPGLHRLALTIAESHVLPAAYVAHYLALAEFLGCDVWTDDQRLLRQVSARLPFVRALADYEPGPET